jgi:antirestriction protein ArdC
MRLAKNLERVDVALIDTATRDAAYIASWLKVLKDDKRAIFTAASHAQKAADYLHGLQPQTDKAPAKEMQEALA